MRHGLIVALAVGLMQSLAAAGQTAVAPMRQPARAIAHDPAVYPERELRFGREGWVVLSYVVRTDGQVRDVVIEQSSGVPAFEEAAVRAARRWIYEPARLDGVAIEEAVTSTRINFRQTPPADSARFAFVRAHRAIMKQIRAGDLDGARTAIAALEAEPTWNLYEDAWYWMLKFSYHLARGEIEPQIGCLRRALAYDGTYLPASTYQRALRSLFSLEVAQGEYASALRTYGLLLQSGGASAELESAREAVNTLIFGPDTLARPGSIAMPGGSWWHLLARREFGLDEVSGTIESLEVRCANQVRRFEWQTGKAWKVPAAWGECTVLVKGASGTRFRLLEFPARPVKA